jgi:hypothetical protein
MEKEWKTTMHFFNAVKVVVYRWTHRHCSCISILEQQDMPIRRRTPRTALHTVHMVSTATMHSNRVWILIPRRTTAVERELRISSISMPQQSARSSEPHAVALPVSPSRRRGSLDRLWDVLSRGVIALLCAEDHFPWLATGHTPRIRQKSVQMLLLACAYLAYAAAK